METTKDKRSNLDISVQAKNLFLQVYEQNNGTNLYGFIPSVGQEYHIAKKECISICDRYSDNRLKDEFIRNY